MHDDYIEFPLLRLDYGLKPVQILLYLGFALEPALNFHNGTFTIATYGFPVESSVTRHLARLRRL